MINENSFFHPASPCLITVGAMGNKIQFTGLSKLEAMAASIAGPMLMAQVNATGLNELQETDIHEQLAKIAVDLAKAIICRVEDEAKISQLEKAK